MCSNYFKLLCFLLFSFSVNGQVLRTNKIIVDSQTKLPLEYVNINNSLDNTITNSEGQFLFISKNNDINISSIGYEAIKITFEEINKQDTIYLKPNLIELDEVVVGNATSILNEVYSKVKNNYFLTSYGDEFFLRGVLKKENAVVRFQDVFGKIQRNGLFVTKENSKDEYLIEISNLRKAGLSEKSDNEYVQFPSFKTLFRWYSAVFTIPNEYNFSVEKSNDSDYFKIDFSKSDENKNNLTRKGYYLINKKDKSIKEVSYQLLGDIDQITYNENGDLKWRTIGIELYINFKRNEIDNKYYIGNAFLKNTFEVIKKGDKKATYEATYDLITIRNNIKEKPNSNFSVEKDIFKAKFPYSEQFWNTQNQLPLTNELKVFLKRISDNKDNKEFEVIGNFK